MAIEDDSIKVLEYLKKHGQTNTFRLATELKIDRHGILNIIKKLEEKQAIEVRSGVAKFLKFPRKEKKVVKKRLVKAKKAAPKPKKKAKHKKTVLETIQTENIRLKEKLSELQNAPPRIIRRTKVEKIIQKVPVKSKKFKEQTERIKELEETVKELQKKASTPPKIIRRTIVKKVPRIIEKIIIKKVPVKVMEEIPKEEEVKPKKFKIPKFVRGLKNIQQLKKPEFIEQKNKGKKT